MPTTTISPIAKPTQGLRLLPTGGEYSYDSVVAAARHLQNAALWVNAGGATTTGAGGTGTGTGGGTGGGTVVVVPGGPLAGGGGGGTTSGGGTTATATGGAVASGRSAFQPRISVSLRVPQGTAPAYDQGKAAVYLAWLLVNAASIFGVLQQAKTVSPPSMDVGMPLGPLRASFPGAGIGNLRIQVVSDQVALGHAWVMSAQALPDLCAPSWQGMAYGRVLGVNASKYNGSGGANYSLGGPDEFGAGAAAWEAFLRRFCRQVGAGSFG